MLVAYLDANSGSLIITALVGGTAAAGVAVRAARSRMTGAFTRKRKGDAADTPGPAETTGDEPAAGEQAVAAGPAGADAVDAAAGPAGADAPTAVDSAAAERVPAAGVETGEPGDTGETPAAEAERRTPTPPAG